MRAYIIGSGVRVEPFGDSISELPVGGVPLREWQDNLLRRFGLDPVRVDGVDQIPGGEPRLVTRDNVFFTRRVLKSFLARSRKQGMSPARAALPADSVLVRRFSELQRIDRNGPHALYDLWLLGAGAKLEDARPLPVVFKEKVLELPVPRRITGVDTWVHPITSSVCMHLRHWLHVLQANLLSIQVRWVDEIVTHPIWSAAVFLSGLFGRGRLVDRLGARMNRIGSGTRIHPTARIEASFIGDGVQIGPQALVRGSIIGAGSTLQERVNVSFSVIGPRSFVSKHSIVYATAGFEEAELCMKGMQMCLVGRRAALTARASPIDVFPGRRIRVKDGDAYPEIDVPVLGSCYGHETFIGADVFVGPGRAIPNGVKIVPQPERVLSRVPEGLEAGRAYAVRNGTLEPL